MADRSVKVTLTAQVSGYIADFNKASKATRDLATDADKLKAKSSAFGDIGRAAMVGGAVVAAGLALAIVKMSEFDAAMSAVKAATQESAENMTLLRDAAIEAGAETAYSATEAANAIEELGKAGLSTQQILNGGLSASLTLAAAGGIGVAEAAGFAAIAMKQFGLEGEALPHVADLLAAGAGKAVGDVDQLAQALNQAGLVANGAGQSIEDTTGVLAAFADAGLLGSDAGTSLKSAIIALQAPTDKSRALMEQYGLSFYDANGNMLGFSEIAGQLESKLGTLTAEERNATLAMIFGNDALRSANVLYEQGAEGIQGYIDQTNDAGYAAKVAADRTNNLAGDIEKLGGSFDTALIKTGSGANEVLRDIVQSATFLVDVFGGLPEPVLAVGLAMGVAAAATLLAGGAALVAAPKFAALKAMVAETGVSMGAFAGKAALTGGALTVATIAIGYFVGRAADAAATTAELTDSLDQTTGALTAYSREIVAKKLAESGAFDSAKTLGISQKELTDAVLEGGDAFDEIQDKFSARNNAIDFFNGSGIAAANARDSVQTLRTGIVDSKKDFEDQAEAIGESAKSTDTAAVAYTNAADTAQALTDNLTSLLDTINASNDVGQDAVSTNAAYQQSLADAAEYIEQVRTGVEGFGKGLDETTEAGSANADMLRGLAEDSQTAAEAQLALDGNTDGYLATVNAGRQTIIDNAIALGGTADEAQALADKIYAIPSAAEVKIIADTADANAKIADTQSRLDRLKATYASGFGAGGKTPAGAGTVLLPPGPPRAKGGILPGAPSSRDNMYIAAASGEMVVNAASTAQNRALLEYINNGGSMANYGSYATPQYASSQGSYSAAPAASGKTIHQEFKTYGTAGMTPELTTTLLAHKVSDAWRAAENG